MSSIWSGTIIRRYTKYNNSLLHAFYYQQNLFHSLVFPGVGVQRLLEAVKAVGLTEKVKLFQASTSELYGKHSDILLNEDTSFAPRSPYADAKLFAHRAVVNFR